MVANASQLPPREVHNRLLQALSDLEKAQKNAVVWFDQVVRRRLYRDFGYSSIYQYAELELGFKKSKTAPRAPGSGRRCGCPTGNWSAGSRRRNGRHASGSPGASR